MPQHNEILSRSILHTLAYYDLFNYPLKSEEIFRFLNTNHVMPNDVWNELLSLSNAGLIYRYDDYFTLQKDESLIDRRKKGNAEAKRHLVIAKNQSRLIMRFPFVRAVLVSGSLSKDFMDEYSDIDFFIITEPGRLWIARILLGAYKKIVLQNSQKQFCLNYYVDFNHLEIEERNLFTATELATALPLQGAAYYPKLLQANRWMIDFFPNYQPRPIQDVPPSTSGRLKVFVEHVINLLGYRWIDTMLMNLFLKRWKKLYQHNLVGEDFKVAFKTKKQVSKSHPNHYQKKVLELYNQRLRDLREKFSSVLS
jgi:hypothetical protein